MEETLSPLGRWGGFYIITRRAVRQTGYRPVPEDWIWHVVLPLVAYVVLLAAAIALGRDATTALFMVAATAVLLLFMGIHQQTRRGLDHLLEPPGRPWPAARRGTRRPRRRVHRRDRRAD